MSQDDWWVKGDLEPRLGLPQIVVGPFVTMGLVEQVLATVQLPAGALAQNGKFGGIEVEALSDNANTANSRTLRIRIGGLTGPFVATRDDAAANNRIHIWARLFKLFDGTYDLAGNAHWSRASGMTGLTPRIVSTGAVDFSGVVDVVATGETPTIAGDLTLRYLAVRLLPPR